jgi:hypothetical protein
MDKLPHIYRPSIYERYCDYIKKKGVLRGTPFLK